MTRKLLSCFRCNDIRKKIHHLILHRYIANVQSDADENGTVHDHQQSSSHSRVKFVNIQEGSP